MFNKMSGPYNSSDVGSSDAASTSVDAGVSQGVGLAEDLSVKFDSKEDVKAWLTSLAGGRYPLDPFQNYSLDFLYFLYKSNKEFKKLAAKLIIAASLLSMEGPHLREPYSKWMQKNLYELRAKVGTNIARIFYCFNSSGKVWLLNGFVKKSQDTPEREIQIALKLRDLCLGGK